MTTSDFLVEFKEIAPNFKWSKCNNKIRGENKNKRDKYDFDMYCPVSALITQKTGHYIDFGFALSEAKYRLDFDASEVIRAADLRQNHNIEIRHLLEEFCGLSEGIVV